MEKYFESHLADRKYKELVDQIKTEKDTKEKLDGIATLLFMIINNDLVCSEKQRKEIKLSVEKLEKKVLIIGCILLGAFIALNPESLKLVIEIIRLVF